MMRLSSCNSSQAQQSESVVSGDNHTHARAVDQSAFNNTSTATLVPSKASDEDA
jgi:hypothetical protein